MKTSGDDTVLVVGAGPAGVSCAMWLDDYEIPFSWVDARGRIGGMLHRVHNRITNVVGSDYEDGRQLAEALESQLEARGLSPRRGEITRLNARTDHVIVRQNGSKPRDFGMVVLATGTTYRRLGIPGEAEGMGKCISQSATADGAKFAGRHVAVVGGGDAGFENAIRLAGHGCRVTMLLRSPDFCARSGFVQTVREHPSIDIAAIPSVVERIEPTDDGCRLHVRRIDQSVTIKVAALFVRIGVDPCVPAGCEELEHDDEGYLVVDSTATTSQSRILAAGDVTTAAPPSVAVAVGQGARAARTCAERLGQVPI